MNYGIEENLCHSYKLNTNELPTHYIRYVLFGGEMPGLYHSCITASHTINAAFQTQNSEL